jgi:hypothetical protein
MEDIISYCGLNCHSCPIYLATREKDEEKRYKMKVDIAQQIKKHYGQECKPEDVTDCDGCKTKDGRQFLPSKNCHVKKCARRKRIENCAHCSEYPCGELEKLFATDPGARQRLDEIKSRF